MDANEFETEEPTATYTVAQWSPEERSCMANGRDRANTRNLPRAQEIDHSRMVSKCA
jgi:hypothetical protein